MKSAQQQITELQQQVAALQEHVGMNKEAQFVICKNKEASSFLTPNIRYQIILEDPGHYQLRDDDGCLRWFSKCYFEKETPEEAKEVPPGIRKMISPEGYEGSGSSDWERNNQDEYKKFFGDRIKRGYQVHSISVEGVVYSVGEEVASISGYYTIREFVYDDNKWFFKGNQPNHPELVSGFMCHVSKLPPQEERKAVEPYDKIEFLKGELEKWKDWYLEKNFELAKKNQDIISLESKVYQLDHISERTLDNFARNKSCDFAEWISRQRWAKIIDGWVKFDEQENKEIIIRSTEDLFIKYQTQSI